jgi:hypothetical protein
VVLCCPPVAGTAGGGAGGLVLAVSVAGRDPVEDDEGQGAEHDHDPTDEEDGGLERDTERAGDESLSHPSLPSHDMHAL